MVKYLEKYTLDRKMKLCGFFEIYQLMPNSVPLGGKRVRNFKSLISNPIFYSRFQFLKKSFFNMTCSLFIFIFRSNVYFSRYLIIYVNQIIIEKKQQILSLKKLLIKIRILATIFIFCTSSYSRKKKL